MPTNAEIEAFYDAKDKYPNRASRKPVEAAIRKCFKDFQMGWDDHLACDLRQDGLTAIIGAWDKVQAADEPEAYGYTVAYHAITKTLKDERGRIERPEPASDKDDDNYARVNDNIDLLVAPDSDPSCKIMVDELLAVIFGACADDIDTRLVEIALDNLDRPPAEAIPRSEIASLVGRTECAVRKRLMMLGQRVAAKVDIPTTFRDRFFGNSPHR